MERTLRGNLRTIFLQYQWRYVKALALVIVANVMLVLMPLVFRQAVTALDTHGMSAHTHLAAALEWLLGPNTSSIWAWVGILFFLMLGAVYFKYKMRLEFIAIGREAECQMRSALFGRMQEQSMAFYDRHGIGELLSRLSNDISAYRDMLGPGIMYPAFFITLWIPGIWALFLISPALAVVSLVPLIAIPLLNIATRRRVYGLAHQAQKGLADLSNMAQEHFAGIRIVKGYVAEHQLAERFGSLCRHLVGVNIRLNSLQGILMPFFNMLIKLVTVILVVATGLIILKAWGTLTTADFLSFMWIQGYIFFPVLMLAWVLPLYQRGNAAYERLSEIFHEPIEVQNNGESGLSIHPAADIEFRRLTFVYPGTQKAVLKDFSLLIKGGTFVGITGPVGAGKSTLFRLLNREYEVPAGTIFIGGKDIRTYPLKAFWKEIVTVEQTPFLFSSTIRENVGVGNIEALEAEIEAAAAFADLHDTVLNFPDQYDTLVGERGVTLSGGQKQRVAMARAFLVDRSILLLDDIFSAVDAETQMRIFIGLQAKLRNKTVLFVTHRVSVLEGMERIIYMQDGKIIEDGSPEELKARKGAYAALVEIQNTGK